QPNDGGLGGELVRGGTVRYISAKSSALSRVVDELIVRPNGVIGDEIKLLPKRIEFFLSVFIQDELDERRIVTEVSHYVVEASAKKAPLVHRGNGIKPSSFPQTESGGEYRTEAREGALVAGALSGRNHQVGIFLPLLDVCGDGSLQFFRLLPPEG